MKKKIVAYTFFCSICKDHFELSGENRKDAEKKFHAHGHENIRRKRLLKGLVGVYETIPQLERRHANSATRRARAKREQDFVHHASTGE